MKKTAPALAMVGDDHQPGPVPEASAATRAFLTLKELQEQVLPLSRRGIYDLRKRGIIPSVESGGGNVLFHRESVIAALVRRQNGNGGAHAA